MEPLSPHGMLPSPDHDEHALQAFVGSLRKHLASRIAPGVATVYQRRVLPRFRARQQRDPADRHEIRRAMEQDGYYMFWSALQRRSQELMWESLADTIEREHGELVSRYRGFATSEDRLGSLTLDPSLQIPRYHTAVDIHLQPGGYHSDFVADDIAAGALYDTALPIYLSGAMGPENDLLGRTLVDYLRRSRPDFRPLRILDMGCAIGNSSLTWARMFPQAEVHAIDVGAPVLRYAHARAESMGVALHFSQQNAEATTFEDASFDLVVSHIMLHETSRRALPRILAESHRLLRPGGLMLHLEIPRGGDAFEQFMYDWETYNNNETFSSYLTDVDLPQLARQAGFPEHACSLDKALVAMTAEQKNYGQQEFSWPVLVGERDEAGVSRRRA